MSMTAVNPSKVVDRHTAEMRKVFQKNFPRSMTGPKAAKIIIRALDEHGFTPQNTLYADSSCPDEINHDDPEEDISGLM